MTDYTKFDGPEFLEACGSDAMKWAEAFVQIHPQANVDEGLMVGWFANAIMNVVDEMNGGGPLNGDHAQYLLDREAARQE